MHSSINIYKVYYLELFMSTNYFIIDIEVCPIKLEKYEELGEEERLKLLNPIDSKVIAIGIRHLGQNKIFFSENEKEMLGEFWKEWEKLKQIDQYSTQIVGFNICNFDLPFLVSRSLINNVTISPFLLKSIIDLREKINAYRYGKTRGKLKDYALLLGLDTENMDGGEVAKVCIQKDWEKLKKYLAKDLEITDELYKRARDTRILEINRW